MAVSKPNPTASPSRIIRDPEFAKRLESAADGHNLCPPMHKGRLTWIKAELTKRFKEDVSVETVRKWFAGGAKPRPEKTAMLAELLQVDVSWLHMGTDNNVGPRERKVRNAMADGAVNLVAGLIQMDGGHPAFPTEPGVVDLHAIIKGAKYDLHVSLADADGHFHVPAEYTDTIVLGVVKHGFGIEIYELTEDVIRDHGERRGAGYEVAVSTKKLKRIESFATRL